MLPRLVVVGVLAIALSAVAPGGWIAGAAPAPIYLLLKLRPDVSADSADALYQRHGAVAAGALHQIGVERIAVPGDRADSILSALAAEPAVEYVESDRVPRFVPKITAPFPGLVELFRQALTPFGVPNDPFFRAQWAPTKLNVSDAWDVTTGRPEISVAVIDSGFYFDHEDRPKNLFAGPDFVTGSGMPRDGEGHGTHVAGIIGANANNGIGVAGIAPDASVGIIRVLNENGVGSILDGASAIMWAADNGYKVINLSLGGPRRTETERRAVEYAHGKGVLLVAAAGNCGDGADPSCRGLPPNFISYPAAFDQVLAVAATDRNDVVTPWSQHGSYVDLAAPGLGIASTYLPGAQIDVRACSSEARLYCAISGTSQASPQVAGVAALVWSANPKLTADEVTNLLKRTAVDINSPGADEFAGAGRVDARAAVQAARATLPPTNPTPTPTPAPSVKQFDVFLPTLRQWFSSEATGAQWLSGVQIANLDGSGNADVTVQYYGTNGAAGAVQSSVIPANGSQTVFDATLGLIRGTEGAAIVKASRPATAIVNQLVRPDGGAASFNAITAPATRVSVPLLTRIYNDRGSSRATTASVFVQNAGAANTAPQVELYTLGRTAPVTTRALPQLAPGQGVELDLSSVSELGTSWAGTAVVTATERVAVAVNLWDGVELSSYSAGSAASTIYAPLIQGGNSGYSSTLFVQNAGSKPTTITVRTTDGTSGARFTSSPVTLEPGVGTRFEFAAYRDGRPFVGSAMVSADNDGLVVGAVTQANHVRKQASAYTLLATGTERVVAPLVQTGNSGWTSGVQVQNVGDASATVSVRLGGREVQSVTIPAGQSVTWFPVPGTTEGFVGAAEFVGSSSAKLIAIVNQLKPNGAGDQLMTYEAINP
ncbi:MAG: S8 family serine peptidase [Chloroflexi bacterium]|nr:S8 family serine peptidase [Chloroflexota bacterium]